MMTTKHSQSDKYLEDREKKNAIIPEIFLHHTGNSSELTERQHLTFLNVPRSAEAESKFLVQYPAHLYFVCRHRN